MAGPYTHTHTVFFDEENLAPLRKEIEKLEQDYLARKPYIDADIKQRFDGRFTVLKAAVDLLAEPAD